VHHVLEVAADDGTDDEENLRVYCSACHFWVNWVRTYFWHYHPEAQAEIVQRRRRSFDGDGAAEGSELQ
jgi:hypothetical protein